MQWVSLRDLYWQEVITSTRRLLRGEVPKVEGLRDVKMWWSVWRSAPRDAYLPADAVRCVEPQTTFPLHEVQA